MGPLLAFMPRGRRSSVPRVGSASRAAQSQDDGGKAATPRREDEVAPDDEDFATKLLAEVKEQMTDTMQQALQTCVAQAINSLGTKLRQQQSAPRKELLLLEGRFRALEERHRAALSRLAASEATQRHGETGNVNKHETCPKTTTKDAPVVVEKDTKSQCSPPHREPRTPTQVVLTSSQSSGDSVRNWESQSVGIARSETNDGSSSGASTPSTPDRHTRSNMRASGVGGTPRADDAERDSLATITTLRQALVDDEDMLMQKRHVSLPPAAASGAFSLSSPRGNASARSPTPNGTRLPDSTRPRASPEGPRMIRAARLALAKRAALEAQEKGNAGKLAFDAGSPYSAKRASNPAAHIASPMRRRYGSVVRYGADADTVDVCLEAS